MDFLKPEYSKSILGFTYELVLGKYLFKKLTV